MLVRGLLLFVLLACTNATLSCPHYTNRTWSWTKGQGKFLQPTNGQVILIPSFTIFNNIWGVVNYNTTFSQSIFNCTNGAGYGWSWDRDYTSFIWSPNYPETVFGLGPMNYGLTSTNPALPARLSAIPYLEASMDIDHEVDDFNGKYKWNIAYDIWLASVNPAVAQAGNNITDEIMIWFYWGKVMDTTVYNATAAVSDGYATYDLVEASPAGLGQIYWQFRISGGQRIPPKINLKPFLNYVQRIYKRPDVFLCSIEFGSENWDNTTGTVIVRDLTYNFNAPTTTTTTTTTSTTKAPTTTTTAASSTTTTKASTTTTTATTSTTKAPSTTTTTASSTATTSTTKAPTTTTTTTSTKASTSSGSSTSSTPSSSPSTSSDTTTTDGSTSSTPTSDPTSTTASPIDTGSAVSLLPFFSISVLVALFCL